MPVWGRLVHISVGLLLCVLWDCDAEPGYCIWRVRNGWVCFCTLEDLHRYGYSCTRQNFCTGLCPNAAVCELVPSAPGGYTCTCREGYRQDGYNCADVDECKTKKHACDSSADCLNYPGGYNCTCRAGFNGNGLNCTDIDECDTKAAACDRSAVCVNYGGGYNCTCRAGFTGNGRNCTALEVEAGRLDSVLSGGSVAGLVVGVLAVLLIGALIAVFVCRRKRDREREKQRHVAPSLDRTYVNVAMTDANDTGISSVSSGVMNTYEGIGDPCSDNFASVRQTRQSGSNPREPDKQGDVDVIYANGGLRGLSEVSGTCPNPDYDRLNSKVDAPPYSLVEALPTSAKTPITNVTISGEVTDNYDQLKHAQDVKTADRDLDKNEYGHLYGGHVDDWNAEGAEGKAMSMD